MEQDPPPLPSCSLALSRSASRHADASIPEVRYRLALSPPGMPMRPSLKPFSDASIPEALLLHALSLAYAHSLHQDMAGCMGC